MSALVSAELHYRISQFLYEEARLLDDWQFRDWLTQLDDEIRYTMRTTVNARPVTVAKGSSHRPPGSLMTTKTSLSAGLLAWRPAWHGQRSRHPAPAI